MTANNIHEFPSPAAAAAKNRELAERIAELQRRRDRLQTEWWLGFEAARKGEAGDKVAAAADAILAGDAATPPKTTIDHLAELRAIDFEMEALWEARRRVVEQQRRFTARSNAEAAARLEPEHRELVRHIASTALHLAKLNAEEAQLRRSLPAGAHLLLPDAGFPGLGALDDPGSKIRLYLRWCRSRGYISKNFTREMAAE
jgi:hypothetical protein